MEIKTKLDLKNKKILFELEQDSRQSLQQLAKKVGLSKEAIFHRVKNLEKVGIIKKYVLEIDVYKLGYQYCPILLRLQNTTPEIEKKILNYLEKNEYVAWLTTCEGNWDINLTLFTKNNFELHSFLSEFLEKYGQYVSEKQIFITTEMHYFKRGFWLDKATTQTMSVGGGKVLDLKEEDLELLKVFSGKARISLVEMARKLKSTSKAISYRIKRLEKIKVIQGSRILVDFSKVGYKYYKILFSLKKMNRENWKKLLTSLHFIPNVIWVTKLIGKYDLSVEMEVKGVEEFRKVLNEIKEKFSDLIKEHESLLIFEERVLDYLPRK